jgi:hypothetical protein
LTILFCLHDAPAMLTLHPDLPGFTASRRAHWRRLVFVSVVAVAAGGCVMMPASKLTQRPFTPLARESGIVTSPPLNRESVAQVGDTMIQASNVVRRAGIRLARHVAHTAYSKSYFTLHIPAGLLKAAGTATSGSVRGTFFEAPQPLRFVALGGTVFVKGGVFLPDPPMKPSPEVYWHATDSGVPLVDGNPEIRFESVVLEESQSDSKRRELIYNGRSGQTIRLLYREFLEDLIRPAFTQELTYDLTRGETIGFKGARFQVIDADNISIRYTVVRHLD